MESIRAHSALQFLGNGAQPFTCDGLAVAPEVVNVCDPADWGAFKQISKIDHVILQNGVTNYIKPIYLKEVD